jgi:hypothetical protein
MELAGEVWWKEVQPHNDASSNPHEKEGDGIRSFDTSTSSTAKSYLCAHPAAIPATALNLMRVAIAGRIVKASIQTELSFPVLLHTGKYDPGMSYQPAV